MSDLPEIRNGRLPMGEARAGQNNRGIDWKTQKLITALLIGIDTEIEDGVCGTIPAGQPLPIKEAARAVGMSVKRARALQLDPAFQSALKTAAECSRECQDSANLAAAIAIRDHKESIPGVKLRAIDFVRGPEPAPACPPRKAWVPPPPELRGTGYVIMPEEPGSVPRAAEAAGQTSEHKDGIIAPRKSNIGDVERDMEQERAEQAKAAEWATRRRER